MRRHLGGNRGGLTTQLHAALDQRDWLLRLVVTAGPRGDAPQAEVLIADHPGQETFRQRVENVRAHGVKTPTGVLPPGDAAGLPPFTVTGGYTRARATVPAWVRHDLLRASRAVVDQEFLSDNTVRRQMSMLAQARAAIGLHRACLAERGRTPYGSVFAGEPRLRTEVGGILGMWGRYLNALEAGRVNLVRAARVANPPAPEQRTLAARLAAGEDAGSLFEEDFPRRGDHVPGRVL